MRFAHIEFAASLCAYRRCVVDGGAHRGIVTGLLSGLGFKHIIAVEPGPAFTKLNASFGGMNNVTLLQAALGRVHNQMVWYGPPVTTTRPNFGFKLWYADSERPGDVRMVRFDDEFPNHPVDLVKLDLEGGELGALQGMANTLVTNRPVVVCETADWVTHHKDGPGRHILFEYMAGLGYRIARAFDNDTVWEFPP